MLSPPPPLLVASTMSDLTNCFYEFGISFSLLGQAESDALGGALTRFGGVAEKVAIFTNALVCALKSPLAVCSPPPPHPHSTHLLSIFQHLRFSHQPSHALHLRRVCVKLRPDCRLMESACTLRSPSRTSCV